MSLEVLFGWFERYYLNELDFTKRIFENNNVFAIGDPETHFDLRPDEGRGIKIEINQGSSSFEV